ncbi:hypothetical protein DFH09DRAFT_1080631 [Mycena vulgaris]|nr:hypothetical protein DFH09DRAFT_1080631 [Mycena vulgaris]
MLFKTTLHSSSTVLFSPASSGKYRTWSASTLTLLCKQLRTMKHDDVINWLEAKAVRGWLEEVKGAAERRLDETGVTYSFGFPPDPDHIAPFCHPILSDTFPPWFLSLKDDIEAVASASSHGRSEKGCAAADAQHAAIA